MNNLVFLVATVALGQSPTPTPETPTELSATVYVPVQQTPAAAPVPLPAPVQAQPNSTTANPNPGSVRFGISFHLGSPASSNPTPSILPTNGNQSCTHCDHDPGMKFIRRFCQAYKDEFNPPAKSECNNDECTSGCDCDDKSEAPRRALPAPFASPPFPNAEWQGFPLIGVPPSDSVYPLMKALYGGPHGDAIKNSRIKASGWINASGNYSSNDVSNTPSTYWIQANRLALNEFAFRLEREVDTVQTSHIDWGFRSTVIFGTDYRNFTAGGWGSDQLLVNNRLYGWDPTENFVNVYLPGIAKGLVITTGRWTSIPDIEAQMTPDNYMGTRSLLFNVDAATMTGVMATAMLNEQWSVQAGIHAGADMAPWYEGAMPTGLLGVRWVSCDNHDSVYTVLNAVNNAEFQYFDLRGVPAGHHNYNIAQTTWQHKFNDCVNTKTEAYYMWERNAPVGNTSSIGSFQFNSGDGLGPTVPGLSSTYGVLNYTMFKTTDKDFLTVRNEWVKDEHGTRFGFPGNYTSNSIGWSHNFNAVFQVRPEIGYYRNWNGPAFDNGQRENMVRCGMDMTLRY